MTLTRNKTLFAIITLTAGVAWSDNWPSWRGPAGTGVAAPGRYPVVFSPETNLLWQARLPGKGGSTPIVWGDRIVLTSGVGEGEGGLDGVLCFDWNGRQLWVTTLGKQRPGKHHRASGSNPSPVTDGQRIFAYFKSGTLAALDFDGKILWQTNLQKRYGPDTLWWDLGTSPVLAGENVVVAVMQEGNSYVVAFNQATGEQAWHVERNYPGEEETRQSYTTPLVVQQDGRTVLVIWGADRLSGHDAATGATLWSCGGFNPENKAMWRVIASPGLSGNVAVVPYGREQFVAGVRIGGKGDITDTARIWERRGIGSDSASPVAHDGKAYIINFRGRVWGLDLLTGETRWETLLPNDRGVFYSSPVLAGDLLYFVREEGAVYVGRITAEGLRLENRTRFDDYFVASPVLVRDRLLLRGAKNLYAIGEVRPAPAARAAN